MSWCSKLFILLGEMSTTQTTNWKIVPLLSKVFLILKTQAQNVNHYEVKPSVFTLFQMLCCILMQAVQQDVKMESIFNNRNTMMSKTCKKNLLFFLFLKK